MKATVYIRGKKWKDEELNTAKEAEHLLREVGNLNLCSGCGLKPMNKSFSASNGCYCATNCYLVSETACVACKYLRKLTRNTLSRKKKKASTRKTQVSRTRALWSMKRKLEKLQKVVGEMKSQNELLSKMEFEHRISGLPCKQQLAVRACFDASMRKSAKVHRRMAT